jgi:hypothetical protein
MDGKDIQPRELFPGSPVKNIFTGKEAVEISLL